MRGISIIQCRKEFPNVKKSLIYFFTMTALHLVSPNDINSYQYSNINNRKIIILFKRRMFHRRAYQTDKAHFPP